MKTKVRTSLAFQIVEAFTCQCAMLAAVLAVIVKVDLL